MIRENLRDVFEMFGEMLVVGIPIILAVSILVVSVVTVAVVIEKQTCNALSALSTSNEFNWGFWTGCLVKMPNGFWIDVNEAGYIMLEQVEKGE